jgi:hypothetical protein
MYTVKSKLLSVQLKGWFLYAGSHGYLVALTETASLIVADAFMGEVTNF